MNVSMRVSVWVLCHKVDLVHMTFQGFKSSADEAPMLLRASRPAGLVAGVRSRSFNQCSVPALCWRLPCTRRNDIYNTHLQLMVDSMNH